MRSIKKGGRNTKRILVLFVLLGIITALAPAAQANGQNILWVVPENPTRYSEEADVFLSDTVIKDVIMGGVYTDNVLVICKAGKAEDIYLRFLVSASDNSCIENITIGEALKVQPDETPTTTPNVADQTPETIQQADFIYIDNPGDQRDGWGASYHIGDLDRLGNPDDIGDVDDLATFHPEKADVHIRVPFTITFKETPPVRFILYTYANNPSTNVKTAWSHDGGFHQIPEFTTIAIPAGMIFGLFYFFRRKRQSREE